MDKGIEALIADMKSAALKATPGPWRRTSTQFNGITHGPFSFTKEDVLGYFAEKCNAEFVSECDPKNVLALIAALEQAQHRNSELEVYSKTTLEFREAARDENRHLKLELRIAENRIAELESAPNGMMQLSNELAEMKRKCVELESHRLCVKSNDAMREAAPLCVKLPDSSSKAFWSGIGKTEEFHPETYKHWVKEAIERAGDIAGIKVEVK